MREEGDNKLVSEHFRHDGKPKKSYATRVSAEVGIIRDHREQTQYAYPCGFCGGWHRATRHDEEVE